MRCGWTLTSAGVLEVRAAVAELEARVVAVARLVAEVLDDCVDGRLLHDAGGVPARTAELRLPAAAAGRGRRQRQHDDDEEHEGEHAAARLRLRLRLWLCL